MPWTYNPKTLGFENTPPPPPTPTLDPNSLWNDNNSGVMGVDPGTSAPTGSYTLEEVQKQWDFLKDPANDRVLQEMMYPSSTRTYTTDSSGRTYESPQSGGGGTPTARTASGGGSSGGSSGGWIGGSTGGSTGGSAPKPPTADDIVPGAGLLSKIPAPPGYAWSINPLTGEPEPVDLTPLDPAQPLAGWKWITDDPSSPEKGHWTFVPTPDVLENPFEGIPTPVLDWVKVALNNGGDISQIPAGPAQEWVKFILTQATNPGRRPDTVPFGLGLPNFARSGYTGPYAPSTPMPQAPTSDGGTDSGGGGGGQEVQTLPGSDSQPNVMPNYLENIWHLLQDSDSREGRLWSGLLDLMSRPQ